MQHVIRLNDKQLTVLAACLNGPESSIGDLAAIINPIWQELAPFIKLDNQVIYIRDIPGYTIDGKYPYGSTYILNETQIALRTWAEDRDQLQAVIAHELHHMARWQNASYGETLGQAIITEGLASVYEELKSGWMPPWGMAEITSEARKQAKSQWNTKDYGHSDWFFEGPHGKWVGYALGYELVKKMWPDAFKLEESITQQFDYFDLNSK